MMSSTPVSQFSLETFDTNLCLICCVEFMKDGNINAEKINFLEVFDEDGIVKPEVVSISITLNTVLRLPPGKWIDEYAGSIFGCCSVCTNLLSRLYGLHKKLDTLRGLDSVISKILDINESSTSILSCEPEEATVKSRPDPSSRLVINPSLLTCDEEFGSSDSECSTGTSGVTELNTLLESALQEEVEESILILAPESAAKEQCPNCCVDLQLKSRIGFTQVECSSAARRGVDAVLYNKPSSVSQTTPLCEKILVSDMLNNFLKLPPENPWTRELRMCSECAPMLLRVHIALQRFENARKPESRLKLMYQDMRSFMHRRTAPVKSPTCLRKTLKPSNNTVHVSSTISGLTVKKSFVAAEITKKVLESASATACSQMADEDSSSGIMDVYKSEATQGNESDSSWSMSSAESFVSRKPITTRSRSATTLNASLQKRITAPAKDLVETRTKQRICVKKLPVKRIRMRKLPTTRRTTNEEKSPQPPKKRGRPPRKDSDSNDSNNEVEPADPKPMKHKKTNNKVRSMEQIEQQRIRCRANYWSKVGNADKITHKPCRHCGKVMRNKNKFALKIHIRRQHKHIGNFPCKICGKPHVGISEKEQHEKTHLSIAERIELKKTEPIPKWLCPKCGKVLASQTGLNAHSKTHAKDDTRRFRCGEINCDYSTVDRRTMIRHVERVHNPSPSASPRFKCKVCNKEFQVFNDLKNHEMTICDAANRPFTCDQGTCQSRFKLKQGLLHHLRTAHPFSVEEAREKLYPGLPCPDWVAGKYARKRKLKSGGVRTAYY